MKEISIKEFKFPTTFECFKQFVESMIPIDAWLDSMPEDVDNWKIEYELTDYPGKTEYRCLIRYYDIEDDFIVNAVIESRPIHE